MTPDHVIFGTGPVGRATMQALVNRGQSVRMVNRSGRASVPDGVEVVGGDAMNHEFTRSVSVGASTVYQILNPPYYLWAQEFPALQASVLAAAESNGALFVNMDNLYSYGRQDGEPLTELTPENPHTRKGGVRKRMADTLWRARAEGRVRVVSGRASDYFGPGGGESSPLGDRVFPRVLAGKNVSVIGNPDRLHSYTFIPDIGEGLATLALTPEAEGEVWHLPNDPHPQSTRRMIETAYRLAGTTGTVRSIPTVVLRMLGLTNRTIREVVEMAYEFEDDFVVDSTKIARLGITATPIDEAIERTLASYRR
ncbi:NAD-dependent epimerase/dehydratase family protein [Lacisediminihabitans profunda]|uniref:NAD-dependent epimerase/dehydratase family protein n=1 Tax=Lacisediminihabitans profunda TaxID=2594790 RepID=A0A5C8UKT3_9MICO|nr:NAD-dependent epimerase/dehydratase family protein [Lacisediminihabitans profunda]TXN27942.1 NAD-dependent epimerase/dehydratase family protein [Lacisediminihabitans profunda]